MPSATRPSQTLTPRALSGLRSHIAERHDGNWHSDWNRGRVHFDHGRFFVFNDGFWFGLDAGLFPWDYLPYYANDYYPYDYYADVDPYNNNGATYDIAPADSATIQAVQTTVTEPWLLQWLDRRRFRTVYARCSGEVSNRESPECNGEFIARHDPVTWRNTADGKLNNIRSQ